jgi:capsid protein
MNALQRAAARMLGFSFLIDAANPRERWKRPQEPLTIDSVGKEVNLCDWRNLVSDSRKLYSNLGPVKGALCDKAMYSVGRAWAAKYTGKDRAWGEQAERWLNEQWYPTADVRGGMFDFVSDLYLASVSIDRDGEIYVLLTESEDGWPQIQLIPAHLIGCRERDDYEIKDGPYRGLRMMQGVIVNRSGRAVAYRVLGYKPEDDRDYSARDLIQIYEPEWADQIRGFPAFTHALLDLRDHRTIQGYEKSASALASAQGLIVKNETGAPDASDPSIGLLRHRGDAAAGGLDAPEVVTEDVAGARVNYFLAGSGAGIEILKNDRPGPNWESFQNRLIRNALVGAGWPYELTWDASQLGGANVRLLIAKAMRAVEDRQDLMRPVAKRIVGYAVAKAIKEGLLPPNPEWYAWRFTVPARMTVDYGRDGNSDREDYKAQITNLGDILAEEGRDLDTHIAERKAENEKLKAAGLPVGVPDEPKAHR